MANIDTFIILFFVVTMCFESIHGNEVANIEKFHDLHESTSHVPRKTSKITIRQQTHTSSKENNSVNILKFPRILEQLIMCNSTTKCNVQNYQSKTTTVDTIWNISKRADSDLMHDSEYASLKTLNPDIHFDNESTSASNFYDRERFRSESRHASSIIYEPDWTVTKQTSRYAWEIHVYTLGALFLLLELYNILQVMRLWRIQRLLPFRYFIFLHTVLTCVCLTRSFYLLYDGYNFRRSYSLGLSHLLYSITFPCLTSAFSILFYWFLTATQMQLVSPSLQKLQVLIPVIVTHFLISMAASIFAEQRAGMQVVQFVCQIFFITWGLLLFFGYAYNFRKLYSKTLKHQDQIMYSPSTVTIDKYKLTLSTSTKVIFLASAAGLAIVGLEAYAVVMVRLHPQPWPWWLYHTVLRILELFMCGAMSYSTSLPLVYEVHERKCSPRILCSTCSENICCCLSMNFSNKETRWKHYDQQFDFKSSYKDNPSSLTDNSTEELLKNNDMEVIQMLDVRSEVDAKSDSLIIVDDVYVRFQTDNDINRIVDDTNYLPQRTGDFQEVNTFPRNDTANIGCFDDSIDDTDTCDNMYETSFANKYSDIDEINIVSNSPTNDRINTEVFRVPSSVSIAESMEKELIKAFQNLKVDTKAIKE